MTAVVAEMVTRDLVRRRAVLLLLALVPLAFYLARHSDHIGQSIRFACLGIAWAVSTAALFSGTSGRAIEPRLRLAGFRSRQLFLGRLLALWGIGLLLAATYFVIIMVDQDVREPAALALAIALTVIVAAPLGLLLSAFVPRDLEGTLLLVTLIGLQFLVDPARPAAKFLPFWSTRELLTYAVDDVGAEYLRRGLGHGVAVAVVLVLLSATVAAVRLRRRPHVVTTAAGVTR